MTTSSRYIFPFLTAGIISACGANTEGSNTELLIPVHYKEDLYHIKLGQHIDSSKQYIDWTWDAESDPDRLKDTSGNDTYMSLNEALIRFKNDQWLPALFVSTSKNRIQDFSCSMLLQLDGDEYNVREFLEILSSDIPLLADEAILAELLSKGIYQKETEKSIEVIQLELYDDSKYDRFHYKIEFR
ncbi:hypothetical protein N8987_07470 [Crocinitomix sp.]|nr:hypothetical protein [Crocinitomix sp.]